MATKIDDTNKTTEIFMRVAEATFVGVGDEVGVLAIGAVGTRGGIGFSPRISDVTGTPSTSKNRLDYLYCINYDNIAFSELAFCGDTIRRIWQPRQLIVKIVQLLVDKVLDGFFRRELGLSVIRHDLQFSFQLAGSLFNGSFCR